MKMETNLCVLCLLVVFRYSATEGKSQGSRKWAKG